MDQPKPHREAVHLLVLLRRVLEPAATEPRRMLRHEAQQLEKAILLLESDDPRMIPVGQRRIAERAKALLEVDWLPEGLHEAARVALKAGASR